MTESVKILTTDYLDWHAKLTGLPSILTDKICSKLYKRYKKKTGNESWQLLEVHVSKAGLLINLKPENKVSYLSFSKSYLRFFFSFCKSVKKKGLSLSKPSLIQN